jgi:hypothetical protein
MPTAMGALQQRWRRVCVVERADEKVDEAGVVVGMGLARAEGTVHGNTGNLTT